jgi:hypothetical protein
MYRPCASGRPSFDAAGAVERRAAAVGVVDALAAGSEERGGGEGSDVGEGVEPTMGGGSVDLGPAAAAGTTAGIDKSMASARAAVRRIESPARGTSRDPPARLDVRWTPYIIPQLPSQRQHPGGPGRR